MAGRPTRSIMIGTHWRGNGGIAKVISGYKNRGLFEQDVIFIASHSSKHSFIGQSLVRFTFALMSLIWNALRYRVDIVHLHMASRGSYTRKRLLALIAKRFGAKVIIHLHGGEFNTFYLNECTRAKQHQIRQLFNEADCILVLSSQWRDWVASLIDQPSKICLFYNFVECFQLNNTIKGNDILFLGRLNDKKGITELIRAFAIISASVPETKLLLAGDGDISRYETLAKSLGVADKVIFIGWVDGEEKNKLLREARIFCLPSFNEGMPMGVLEAMSAKTAIVATTVGGIPDAIQHGVNGELVTAGDVEELAAALLKLLQDNDLQTRYIQHAYDTYQASFSSEQAMTRLKRIYELVRGS